MDEKICVVGLGYVGLPLALALGSKFTCIGFDTSTDRIANLLMDIDINDEHSSDEISRSGVKFTNSLVEAKECTTFIITVPTPINKNNKPDLNILKKACKTVGQVLKNGDLVIFESTVFPGCTENFCGPLLAKVSGLSQGEDFNIGYSPERINPGDKINTLKTIKKIVSGDYPQTLNRVANIYKSAITAGVHMAKSIEVAEAAKLTENIQRDVNIALMNELASVYGSMGIRIQEVLEAASTKWNFIPFRPGLVGGHCIAVDPYYLIDSAEQCGVKTPLLSIARETNENVVQRILNQFLNQVTKIHNRSLIMGITFKENCNDLRNSKALELADALAKFTNIQVLDPNVDSISNENIELVDSFSQAPYDCVILAVRHQQFQTLEPNFFYELVGHNGHIFDLHDF